MPSLWEPPEVRTLNQFLCGCPVWFGVALIVWINLLVNLFVLTTVTLNIVFKVPTFGANEPLAAQTFNAAWSLLGLPFCFAAVYGMWAKQESNMRVYLLYMLANCGLDLFCTMQFFVHNDVCGSMPRSLQRHGSAFACGTLRVGSVGMVLMMLIIMFYSTFTVWSYCEDLKAGGSGRGFPQLIQYQDEQKYRDAYSSFVNNVDKVGNAINDIGEKNKFPHGSKRIFGGAYHETTYPPPAKSFQPSKFTG